MLTSGVLSALVYVFALLKEGLFGVRGILRLVIVPLIAGLGMVWVTQGLKLIIPIENIFELLCAVGFGACVYFLLLWCGDRLGGGEIFQHITWVYRRVFSVKNPHAE